MTTRLETARNISRRQLAASHYATLNTHAPLCPQRSLSHSVRAVVALELLQLYVHAPRQDETYLPLTLFFVFLSFTMETSLLDRYTVLNETPYKYHLFFSLNKATHTASKKFSVTKKQTRKTIKTLEEEVVSEDATEHPHHVALTSLIMTASPRVQFVLSSAKKNRKAFTQ